MLFRFISTGTPGELKNYIIKSDSIQKTHNRLKDDFIIYKINIRDGFAVGDSFFVDNVYYLESAENFQLTLRGKTTKINQILELIPEIPDSAYPFTFYLKVSATDTGSDLSDLSDINETGWEYVVLETAGEKAFGEDTDRYKYFVVSFDHVKIDYANTKVELYMFAKDSGPAGEFMFVEENALARFTIFDINMRKSQVKAKKLLSE